MKFAIYTLGCKVNQYESQALEKELVARGYQQGHFDEPCDLYIVNTCTVTAVSDKKSRNALRRARKLNPDAVIGVCGCYAQVKPEDMAQLPVDVVGGTGDRGGFIDRMEQFRKDRQRSVQVDNAFRRHDFEVLEPGGLGERTRAMLKVEDGCVNFCSYCIIPYARGAIRSLPLEKAVEQAKALSDQGYRELVVTGIEISSWGMDLKNGLGPQDLILAICRAVPEMRVRLGSLEPRTIDEDFCKMLSQEQNLCPQFHLSLQSGCDETLARMRRKYTTKRYLESCDLLRAWFPDCAITTDLIVGFPQETEAEFTETLKFLNTVGFAAMHIFPYSRRTGTPAAEMEGQIPQTEKEHRAARAAEVEQQLRHDYQARFVGKTLPVLFEQTNEAGHWTGHTPNYILVEAAGEELHNQIRNVRITAVTERGLTGILADEQSGLSL
jgi:threonylcarbamoyladenosine tRNA methylthiotransferase MtaB